MFYLGLIFIPIFSQELRFSGAQPRFIVHCPGHLPSSVGRQALKATGHPQFTSVSLGSIPSPSHYPCLGLDACPFFGDHNSLNSRSISQVTLPLKHAHHIASVLSPNHSSAAQLSGPTIYRPKKASVSHPTNMACETLHELVPPAF